MKRLGIGVGVEQGFAGHCPGALIDLKRMYSRASAKGVKVVTLLDEFTELSILHGVFVNTVEQLAPGDLLLLGYSGHGGDKKDLSGDEPGGRDQYMCLHREPLTDDVVWHMLEQVPARVRIAWICDCCHAGSMYRGGTDRVFHGVQLGARSGFKGELLYFGGSTDDRLSYGDANGGYWWNAIYAMVDRYSGLTWRNLYDHVAEQMPWYQKPVVAKIGEVSDAFLDLPVCL